MLISQLTDLRVKADQTVLACDLRTDSKSLLCLIADETHDHEGAHSLRGTGPRVPFLIRKFCDQIVQVGRDYRRGRGVALLSSFRLPFVLVGRRIVRGWSRPGPNRKVIGQRPQPVCELLRALSVRRASLLTSRAACCR